MRETGGSHSGVVEFPSLLECDAVTLAPDHSKSPTPSAPRAGSPRRAWPCIPDHYDPSKSQESFAQQHCVTSNLFKSSLAGSFSLNTERAGSYNEFCESYFKFQFIILTSHLPSTNDVHQTRGLTLRLKQAWCILLAQ